MGRRLGRAGVGLVALVVLAATAATAGTTAGRAAGGSPASGHAEVIAHGVVPLPTGDLTWRRYDGAAGPLADAEPLTTDWSGFLIGERDPVLADVDGDRSVVAGGTATLVREGRSLTVASVDGNDAAYGWLTLTAAELTTDDDALAFVSDPFTAPSDGDHSVSLIRDVLADDEETVIAAGAVPSVVLVVQGGVSVTVDGSAKSSKRVAAGDGLTAEGELTVRARGDDTVILAAVIADRVSLGETARPTPVMSGDNQQPGAIELTVQQCQPGITEEDVVAGVGDDVCPFVAPEDGDLQLLTFDGTTQVGSLAVADLEPGQTGYVWTGLELRTHVLQVYASDPESTYVAETDQVAVIPGPQYEITLTADEPYALVPIYRLTDAGGGANGGGQVSTVTVTFLGCEAGQEPEVFRPETCIETIDGSAGLASDDSGLFLGPDDAAVNDSGSLTWTLPGYDRFSLVDVGLPEGYGTLSLSQEAVVTTADAPDAYVYVYCFLPVDGAPGKDGSG